MDQLAKLFRASANGDIATVKHLIEELSIDPLCRDSVNGYTPLHFAAINGHLDILRYLVEKRNIDVKCRDRMWETPLNLAAMAGKLDTVRYLTSEQGCNPMCRGFHGRTPLHNACQNGHLDVVKYLIDEQKVDSSCQDEGYNTPLHMAASLGTLEIVKYLIEEKGCDKVCRTRYDNNTPLHLASIGGKLDTVKYLISEKGCDPVCRGVQGKTPLHLACLNGHISVAKYLIDDEQVDPSCRDEDHATPLHAGCLTGQLSVVQLLVAKYVCDPDVRDKWGNTPLDRALQNGRADVASYLQDTVSTDLPRALEASLKRYITKAFRTGKELGSGTYGSVMELVSAGEVVAGKVFKSTGISDAHMQTLRNKLCGEMILMMQIHHQNIVESKGLCFLMNHPLPVLLMERLMSSLHAYLLDSSHHAMELTSKVSILCDVASGLSYLHSHTLAIIHRDLTAKNVLLDSNLKAKIGDFGNAQLMDLDPECSPETFTSLPGTLEYMPPEAQGKHTRYDPSLDVFSFGHLALFTITQSRVGLLPPSYSDSEGSHLRPEVMRRKISIDTAEQILGTKRSLVTLIKRCLHNRPALRPNANEIVTSLADSSNTPQEERAPELRLSEGDCVPDMKPQGTDIRNSEVDQPQVVSSSQDSHPTPPIPSAHEFKRDHTSSGCPLDAKPTIKQLLSLTTKSGVTIDIKTALAVDWKEFGLYFDFDNDGNFLNLIEAECGKHKPSACYQQIMKEWMAGRGEQPASWRTLLKLLREFGKNTLAMNIEDALTKD